MNEEIKARFDKLDERLDKLDERLDKVERRVDTQGKLIMILVSDTIRDQIRKDDLYSFATDEQKLETALGRIFERQNGLSQMILDFMEKSSE